MILLLTRRFLTDHVRNGYNLLLLMVVPVVFVVVAAPALGESARLLGGVGAGAGFEIVTAGWAAAFLSGIAMYFQVSGSKLTDRRLVQAGLPRPQLVAARLLTGAILAVVAAGAALVALRTQTDPGDPWRVAAGTVMYALTYLAIGAVVGATVPNPVNGTVVVMFVWILDVFFGPTLSGSSSALLRGLPTHFTSLWMVNLPSGHGGPSELAWSLVWVVGALLAASLVISAATRTRHRRTGPESRRVSRAKARATQPAAQLSTGLASGWRQWRRVPLFWVLLLVVPAVFILLSEAITPHGRTLVVIREAGRRIVAVLDPADIHSGLMAPIAVGSLACLVGVFVALDNRAPDRRLALCGQGRLALVTTRLVMVASAAVIATAASVAVAALVFQAEQWTLFSIGLLLVALTYGLIGLIIGPVFGRISGVFLAFLLPFIDLGIGQSPMLRGEPSAWAQWLPGYGALRAVIDGGLTSQFDEAASLAIALLWAAALVAGSLLVFRLPRPAYASPSVGAHRPSLTRGRVSHPASGRLRPERRRSARTSSDLSQVPTERSTGS